MKEEDFISFEAVDQSANSLKSIFLEWRKEGKIVVKFEHKILFTNSHLKHTREDFRLTNEILEVTLI